MFRRFLKWLASLLIDRWLGPETDKVAVKAPEPGSIAETTHSNSQGKIGADSPLRSFKRKWAVVLLALLVPFPVHAKTGGAVWHSMVMNSMMKSRPRNEIKAPEARDTQVEDILITSGANDFQRSGQATVIDGDTLEVDGYRFRLFGIDAPEAAQHCKSSTGTGYLCGLRAIEALTAFLGGQPVLCYGRETDKYGRIIAKCSAGSLDIGGWMVQQGWALAYRRYSKGYVPDEAAAKLKKLGIWQGQFEAPWEWRKRHGYHHTK